MPLPLLPLIAAGSSLLGGAMNSISQGRQNEKQRQFELDMYNRQRANALADRAFENDYNSPAAQMKRLTDAGLNPNLVYGNGAAQSQSVATKNTTSGHISPQSTRVGDIVNSLASAFLQTQQIQAQTDNVKAMTEYTKQRTATEVANTDLKQTDAAFAGATFNDRKTAIFTKWLKDEAAVKYTRDQNERNNQMQPLRMGESSARIQVMKAQVNEIFERTLKIKAERAGLLPAQIANLQQQLKNLQQDEQYKKMQNHLWESGINPNSMMGSIAPLANKVIDELINFGEKVADPKVSTTLSESAADALKIPKK